MGDLLAAQPLLVGTAKSNPATSSPLLARPLAKVVLASSSRPPPSIHCDTPNPKINFGAPGMEPVAAPRRGSAARTGPPRQAGLSAFGIGGSNFTPLSSRSTGGLRPRWRVGVADLRAGSSALTRPLAAARLPERRAAQPASSPRSPPPPADGCRGWAGPARWAWRAPCPGSSPRLRQSRIEAEARAAEDHTRSARRWPSVSPEELSRQAGRPCRGDRAPEAAAAGPDGDLPSPPGRRAG